jgi:prepilin-type N-terminal cleavage/methylation domain-containing protein
MKRLLNDQGGFTLPELLTTLSIGTIVLMAGFALIEFVMVRSGDVQTRVEALQRARIGMDSVTRQLRSQVCLSTTVAPMVAAQRVAAPGGTREEVTFYADLSDGQLDAAGNPPPPEMRRLRYEPNASGPGGTLWEDIYLGTGVAPNINYDNQVDRQRPLLRDVRPPTGQPMFKYFAFTAVSPPTATEELVPATALTATQLRRVSRIEVRIEALATNRRDVTEGSTVLESQIHVRAADPNDPSPIPTCA